jgi:hypothetical protein
MSHTSCPVYEVLFSKQDAILSFSCDDLPSHPGEVLSVGWIKDGWVIEFGRESARHQVSFPGAPEDVLRRVAQHEKILVVGLSKGDNQHEPQISLSKEIALPARS